MSSANVPEGQLIRTDKVKGQKTSKCQQTVNSGQLVSYHVPGEAAANFDGSNQFFLFLLKFRVVEGLN